jgi:hypothetical protein
MDHGATGAIHEIVHWVAAVVLVVGGAVVVGLAAWARAIERAQVGPRAYEPAPAAESGGDRSPLIILAGLSVGAAAIHLAAAPSHYLELGDLGAGFLAAAVVQAAWARSVLRGATPRTVVAGVAINVAIVAAWAFSRTVGLPVGPIPFVAEPVGLPDGASTVFELGLLAGLGAVAMARRRPTLFATARPLVTIAAVPILGFVILTSSFASVAIVAGADHGDTHGGMLGGAHAAMENASTR